MRAVLRRAAGPVAPVLVIPAVLLAVDLCLRGAEMLRWPGTRWSAYAVAVTMDFVAYWAAFELTRQVWLRSRRAALLLAGLGAALLGAWTVSAFVYYGLFHGYPAWADLVFVSEEGHNVAETWSLFADFFDLPVTCALLGLPLLIFALWRFALARVEAVPAQPRLALTSALFVCMLLAPRAAIGDSVATSPSASLLVSGAQLVMYYSRRTKGALRASQHRPVPQLNVPAHRPNVLLLLQESLTRSRMSLYGYRQATTPRLAAWVQDHADSEVLFHDATANTSNTSIAVVTLLTGLAPDASNAELHDQPFAWHYAKAAGYHTMLLSAQSFRYAHFDDYFLSSPPDDTWTAERDLVPMANGGGMDDELFVPRVRAAFERASASGKPFFAVLQFNSTHYPYLVKPDRPQPFGSDKLGRYQNAMHLLDGVLVDLLHWLDGRGVLDDTLVLLTSDHGENHDGHEPHRTQSYYEDVTGIPMLVHVPSALRAARPELLAGLRANARRRVQNLDVLPTLLDGMGVLHDPALSPFVRRFGGQSLFSAVPIDRPVLIMNNNAIRTWVNEGFSVASARNKYMFSERYGEGLYDLDADPQEQHSLWNPQHPPPWLDRALREHPQLCALRARHCRPSTGCQSLPCAKANED